MRIINGKPKEDQKSQRVINTNGANYIEQIEGTMINVQGNTVIPQEIPRKDLSEDGSPAIDV
jgi:hypothetical protein